MSRHGLCENDGGYDDLSYGRWRAQVASSIRGKNGQKFMRELLSALDAMPEKELAIEALQDEEGMVCALGAVGKVRGMDLSSIDYEDPESVADAFGITHQLASEIEWVNDEGTRRLTPQQRWKQMREWVASKITATAPK